MDHILIYAYQLHHLKGSEAGLAWDHIVNMSKRYRLTVLYGSSGGFHEIGNTSEIDEYLKDNKLSNVKFVPVKPTLKYHPMGYSSIPTFFFYRQYRKYQKDVLAIAQSIYSKDPFSLVHYLGPIGYREPGELWKLPCPYLWGPIGGVVPPDMNMISAVSGLRWKFYFILKSVLNKIQLHSSTVKNAICHSDLILASSVQTKLILENVFPHFRDKIFYKPQNCIKTTAFLNLQKFNETTIHISWVGTIEARKLLNLALIAIADSDIRQKFVLHVVGTGRDEEKCRLLARELGIGDNIIWHGMKKREDVLDILSKSHLLFLTSMYDVNPTVVWEAMSVCVPVLSTRSKGLEDFFDERSAFLIDNASFRKVQNDFIRALNEISQNPEQLYSKAQYLQTYREKFTWEQRTAFFSGIYDKLIAKQ